MTRDRYGEQLEDEPPEPSPFLHVCDNGWLDSTADRLTPCPFCKAALISKLRTQRQALR
jgi:hypothetical protein